MKRKLTVMSCLKIRAADPHSFVADPEPSAFLKAVPDSAACLMRIRIQLIFKLPYEEISVVENDEKNAQK